MKKFFMAALTLGIVSLFSISYGSDQLACDDLADIADTLEEMVQALNQVGTITEGDEVDTALDDVIGALKEVAEVENNRRLTKDINALSTAWEEMDGASLMQSLNNVIDEFDVIIGKECTQ